MADWFEFRGVRSNVPGSGTDLGVHVIEFPPMPIPEQRKEFKQISGRSGTLETRERDMDGEGVYNDVLLSFSCFVADLTQVVNISNWLRGDGVLILGNKPDYYYKASVINQIDLRKILRDDEHRVFAAAFRCKPYRYVYPAPNPITLVSSGVVQTATVTNPGNAYAAPIYTISGTGEVGLTFTNETSLGEFISEKSISIVNLSDASTGLATSVTIDMDLRVAYLTNSDPLAPRTSIIRKTSWPFTIPPGINRISVDGTGTISEAILDPRWRYV